jgi:hypothetical protein
MVEVLSVGSPADQLQLAVWRPLNCEVHNVIDFDSFPPKKFASTMATKSMISLANE